MEGFLNSCQTKPNYQGFSNGPRQLVPTPARASNAQSQPPSNYSELNKYERRIRSDMERMLRANNERMLKATIEQFSQSTIANREKGIFPSQLRPTLMVKLPLTLFLTLLERSML